jgi:hypothetical protein
MEIKFKKEYEDKNPYGGTYGQYKAIIDGESILLFSFRKTKDRLGILWDVEFSNLMFQCRGLNEVKEKIQERYSYLKEFAWEL